MDLNIDVLRIRKNQYTDLKVREREKALGILLEYYGGRPAVVARILGFNRRTVYAWISQGYVGRRAAITIGNGDGPFTKEYLRPDVLEWSDDVNFYL